MDEQYTIALIVGERCKRLRTSAQVTMESFAATARDYGLKWNTGRVGDFEAGRVSPTLPTLYALTAALSHALRRPVHMYELVHDYDQDYGGPGAGMRTVQINDMISVPDYSVAQSLRGEPVRFAPRLKESQEQNVEGARIAFLTIDLAEDDAATVLDLYRGSGLTEQRIARDLGVDVATIVVTAYRLWGTGFVAERDRIAGDEASPQSRGRVSRDLKAQLQAAIEADRNGND